MTTTPGRDQLLIAATPWQLDPTRSRAEFRTKTLWGLQTVKGSFGTIAGTLDLRDERAPNAQLTIDASTVESHNKERDKHLRSADFFDVERHPTITFNASGIALTETGDDLDVQGELTAGGNSLPLTLTANFRSDGEELELRAEATIVHSEIGMTFNKMGMIKPTTKLLVTARLVRAHA